MRYQKYTALPGKRTTPHYCVVVEEVIQFRCRYPGQEHVAGNSKIPSVLYYDKHGKVKAAGAEAETSKVVSQAEDEQWLKVEL